MSAAPSHLPYPTREVRIEILGRAFTILEVADAEALLDELIEAGHPSDEAWDEYIPYWAELWPSAIGLAQFLLRHPLIAKNQSVLELGCGLGLPSIVAGGYGATVTLSDYLEPALDFARSNWAINLRQSVASAVLDWRRPDPDLAADIVLASDITYEIKNFPFLPDAFHTLCKPGGKIILSDPRRQVAQAFFHRLPEAGFKLEKFEEVISLADREVQIDIYVLEWALETK